VSGLGCQQPAAARAGAGYSTRRGRKALYYFRLLKAQGPDASEGASSYIQGGKMTGGFAFIAWPANYAATGIMTFIVNQDGNVFQKDLGPETGKIVSNVTSFNPDLSWALVNVSD
jgi:hypothetical protein